ncbi:Hypothetical protein Minf_2084 [Methylacidiphilum infernorum V4]|uniref:Uncharacterized protein n=1 Tax=Methylacidiphilum infernorum (isolate V4) TaxID=481448 RepID=B3DZ46_METI4|nr:Hypothetical protein Minf_2084 [Methylacidiphilum infernorum V4]
MILLRQQDPLPCGDLPPELSLFPSLADPGEDPNRIIQKKRE